jgi:hypothetical protein
MNPRIKRSLALVALLMALGMGYGWFRFHQPGLAKDGLGLLGKHSGGVCLGEERNKVTWQEDDQVLGWTGRPRSEAETVYFDGRRVYPMTLGRALARKGFVIRFSPQRIQVFDLEHLSGEYYSPRGLPN